MTDKIEQKTDDQITTLGARVKFARECAGFTQKSLADLVGVTQPSIGDIERGTAARSAYLPEIARACAVDIHWLAFGEGAAPNLMEMREQEMRHGAEKWESLYRNEHSNCTRLLDTVTGMRSDNDQLKATFKNFHRSICERFGYYHDDIDWQRDQVSLEEHIATQFNHVSAENTALRGQVEALQRGAGTLQEENEALRLKVAP